MKALVLHGPGSYKFEPEWPRPEQRPGWALIRVRYAGICGSDLPRFAVTGSYRHPMILGHEFSGTVEEPAPGSSRFGPGDEVAVLPIIPCGACEGCRTGEPFHCSNYQFIGSRNDGGYAELCRVPEDNLLRIPAEFGLRAGAFIEPIAVALHVVRRSGFEAGKSAIVFGAGAIGLLVAMWLRAFGASRVVVADIRPDSIQRARSAGFEEAYDPSAAKPPGLFDAAFEAAGSSRALVAAVESAKDKAVLTVVGRDVQDTVLPRATFEALMRKELTAHGCWGYNLGGEEELLMRTLRRGEIRVDPLITHEIGLEEAAATIAGMIDHRFSYCKVLVRMDG